ncbi:MAG: CPBP family intramembrane metalloprotease [Gammaproteobacteria bacterium]|jgi:membrane protease YdiL (CAAX protease family)|nr:CPBP family intramembrane metalloprotease [Gammaproteobacteria bacterium]NBR16696.1 CPBP family intramembrane metalloprotease [Gammaproteobacteria bacterium]
MRTFLWFMGLFAIGFGVMAVLAWPLYDLLTPTFDLKFHRVANRLGMLTLLIAFVLVARRLALADRQSLGYGLPRAQFLRETALGLIIGVGTMLPVALVMLGLDLRVLRAGVVLDAATIFGLVTGGLATGLAVALIEETFLRGAMHSGIARESGAKVAIFLTATLYASLHFVGRYRIPIEELGPDSGLRHVLGTLADFATPLDIIDAWLALFAVGVLLGMVRALTGNIAACIGLHAGWVWIISVLRETSQPDENNRWRFLLSQFDGVVGWLVLAATALIGIVLYAGYSRRTPAR